MVNSLPASILYIFIILCSWLFFSLHMVLEA